MCAARTSQSLPRGGLVDRPLVELRGITKRFGKVVANDSVDLDLYPAQVHALLGENGAGKSTLVKILYGFYSADAGEIRVAGRPERIFSPHHARRLGIGMVFQTYTLIPALSVVENVALFLPALPFRLGRSSVARALSETSERYGLGVDPHAPVWRLSVGERQKVEILKLLLADARVLILDEPTRVLAPHEVEGLFRVFDRLRGDGYAVLFITHRLGEVLACADRITVLRHGKVTGSLSSAEASESALISMMFSGGSSQGYPVTAPVTAYLADSVTGPITAPLADTVTGVGQPGPGATEAGRQGRPLLELRNVWTGAAATTGVRGTVGLKDVSLEVMPREIVGVAGVSGNGQRELVDVILGVERCSRGTKLLLGEDATRWPVARVRASGVAFIPEDPLIMAAVPGLSVDENMALGDVRRYSRRRGFSIDWRSVRSDLEESALRLGLKLEIASTRMPTGKLSGGTLQRLFIARELSRSPKLIVASYPTRGLDVAGAAATRRTLAEARARGAGVLFISEDLGELFSLSDRIVVLYRGRVVGTLHPQETSVAEVGFLMTGGGGEGERAGA